MKQYYQSDSIKLDAERVSEHVDDTFGLTTVFHDVVIASEMVQPYDDGRAWKNRDELEAYSWTVDGAWVIVGGHPTEGIISDRAQVSGRTVNPRYVKNLKDNTGRPHRAGVRADIEIFNDKVPKETLDDMKNGKLADVSIGFFFSKDDTAGMIEDGPFKGDEYDYVQRNMFHNHTAAGIDNGRCPMPYCGLGADEIRQMISGDPFAGFEDFDDCMSHMTKPKKEGGEGYDEETARKVCGELQAQHEDIKTEKNTLNNAKKKAVNALLEILDAVEAAKGELDAKKATVDNWWISLNWKDEELTPIYDRLDEDTKQQIIEAGLCPTCGDEDEEEEPPSDTCVCPECGATAERPEDKHCPDVECPECGAAMRAREPGSGGGKGEGGPSEDEDLPYEDGEALDYTLTPVERAEREDESDVFEVLERARRVLREE